MKKTTDLDKVIGCLAKHQVSYIIVGGVSAALQGAPLITFDLDILHQRTPENTAKLLAALEELDAYHRTKPDMRIKPDLESLQGPGHHLLLTKEGPLDVLGVIGARGHFKSYDDITKDSESIELSGVVVKLQSLTSLIEIKELIGRDKDRQAIPILQATRAELEKSRKAEMKTSDTEDGQ